DTVVVATAQEPVAVGGGRVQPELPGVEAGVAEGRVELPIDVARADLGAKADLVLVALLRVGLLLPGLKLLPGEVVRLDGAADGDRRKRSDGKRNIPLHGVDPPWPLGHVLPEEISQDTPERSPRLSRGPACSTRQGAAAALLFPDARAIPSE